ncbi:MAG: DUF58 domain-containing protein [Myxococcaceae bacterium]
MSARRSGLLAWARALVRPPRGLKVTRAGRTYLIVTLGVGLGALNTGNNLLYLVLGLMLATILVSGVLSERCLQHLEVRRLGTEAAYAGEPFAFRYGLRRTRGSGFALMLSEDGAKLEGRAFVAFLPPGEDLVARADLVAPHRGPLELTGIKVSTAYPLGLFEKSRVLAAGDRLLVFPRRGFTCADPAERDSGPVGDAGNPRRRDGTGDLLGLRELAPFEDARRVHWMKSAAAGKLLKVEREREERRQFLLSVDPGLRGEALERRCEETAAQTRQLLEQGHEVGLDAGGLRLRPSAGSGQHRRILSALAWLGFEEPS